MPLIAISPDHPCIDIPFPGKRRTAIVTLRQEDFQALFLVMIAAFHSAGCYAITSSENIKSDAVMLSVNSARIILPPPCSVKSR